MKRWLLTSVLFLLFPGGAPDLHAQEAAPPRALAQGNADDPALLTPSDYGRWERLESFALSPDGGWLSYRVRREDGEGRLHLRKVDADSLIAVPRGSSPQFSPDGDWIAFSFALPPEEEAELRSQGRPVSRTLGLVEVDADRREDVAGVAEYRFSPDSRYLAMARTRGGGGGEDRGRDLVLRELATGGEISFGNVADFRWRPGDGGSLLAFVVDSRDGVGNGVRLYDPVEGRIRVLHSGEGRFGDLVWDGGGEALAVVEEGLEEEDSETQRQVWAWTELDAEDPKEHHLDPARHPHVPEGMRISGERGLEWASGSRSLFLGLQPFETAEPEEGAAPEDVSHEEEPSEGVEEVREAHLPGTLGGASDRTQDPPEVEIWHTRDLEPVPRQRVQDRWESGRARLSVWHVVEDTFIPLEAEGSLVPRVEARGTLVLDVDASPYREERMFGPAYQDVYVVEVESGHREQALEGVEHFFGMSSGGRYLLYLQGDDYWVFDRQAGDHRNLTGGLPGEFVDRDNDHTVEQKPPFGMAGWASDDEWVLAYDRYDLWKLHPDGSGGERLTTGAEARTRHRVVYLAENQEGLNLEEGIFLVTEEEETKAMGYALLREGEPPISLFQAHRRLSRFSRADDGGRVAFVAEAFHIPPNVYVMEPESEEARQVTHLNEFQDEYLWGRAELLGYQTEWGDSLQAALFLPAGYQEGERFPTLVFPYERRSGTLHEYHIPSEREPYNPTVWTQRGYAVLAPDILYRPRNPGRSAVVALEAAVDAAVAAGGVDPDRVGLVGHSWGGYQTTFALTQTDRFQAGMAGAPLTNLISMYLSFYWSTGDPDARIFETSQARMEVPWWEDYSSYVANSPVHHIETLNTPLLMAFGTEDGAVDFHQGVEFYNAARRAGRDVVLLVYEGEGHSLARTPNRIDLHRRILEWFDHYLKGEPARPWITEGVPYRDQRDALGPGGGRFRR